METICLRCPIGCNLTVEEKDNKISVKGNSCPRGKAFGENELRAPKRVVTSLVKRKDGVISVKTSKEIDKSKIFDCLQQIKKIKIDKEVLFGEVLIHNVLGTDSDIVVTSNLS